MQTATPSCPSRKAILALLLGLSGLLVPVASVRAQDKPLIDFGAPGAEARVQSDSQSKDQVAFKIVDGADSKALAVTIQPGPASYPGVNIMPPGPAWDLSNFGHVEARIMNTGTKRITMSLEPWNGGDWRQNPFNCEMLDLKPGASGTLTVIFGYSYGRKPGYALKPAAVVRVMLFAGKAGVEQSFRVESLVAGGPAGEKPPVDPASVRIVPKDGVILGPGAAADPATATQVEASGGAKVQPATAAGVPVELPAGKGEQTISLQPPIGRWDLRQATDIYIKVKNQGQTPVTLRAQATSNSGPTDPRPAEPLAPGAEREIVVPFAALVPWRGKPIPKDQPWQSYNPNVTTVSGTGTSFFSDAVGAIKLFVRSAAAASLLVELVTAKITPAQLPDWLGKRPPVPGDWVQTLDENFGGSALDRKLWTPKMWWNGPVPDQMHVYSEKNVLVDNGFMKIKSEKKHGHEYDDPKLGEKDYTSGATTTQGKWMQRYGYFEARVKSPKALGLWPCFWLMPDRGASAGRQRMDMYHGGMEVDIMEHPLAWGPYHYNIACHWDGYGKDHKSIGSGCIYASPDAEGFVTAGLLWEPGKLTWYCNGQVVGTWESDRVASVSEFVLFTVQMGGWGGGPHVSDELLPDYFVIKYLRIWQRKNWASGADGYQAPKLPATQPEK